MKRGKKAGIVMARDKMTIDGEPHPETGEWVTFPGVKGCAQVARFFPQKVHADRGYMVPETWRVRDTRGKPFTYTWDPEKGGFARRFGWHMPPVLMRKSVTE